LYSVIDIETTGLSPNREKITEIAIYVHDGEKVVDEFVTLLNPEIEIPYRITQLTGINNKMVQDCPKFYEVAKRIVEMTEDTTFVGHNVNFDYNFVRKEFRELGYDYQRKKMCTCKLSRKLLPGRRSYSLGKLCQELGIENPHRHRAFGDAKATLRLFEILLKVEKNVEEISLHGLNTNLDRNLITKLPQEPGVYYFYNDSGSIIYIGKSVNIKSRVMSHLSNNDHKREIEMREKTASVTYELTGSDLVASLLESAEIKKHKPVFNRSLRRSLFQYGLFSYTAKDGYIHFSVEQIKGDRLPLTSYSSRKEGMSHLQRLLDEFNLCQKLCGLYTSSGGCFDHHMGICRGACIGDESPAEYNDRVIDAISKYTYKNKNFFIVDDGRFDHECSVVKVENGRYIGFGYVELDNIEGDAGILHDIIKPFEDNRDAHVIIRGYLRKNHFEKMIVY